MKRAIIFCWAFGLVLGMVKQTIAAKQEISTDRMRFQEVEITLVGTAETRAHYFAG